MPARPEPEMPDLPPQGYYAASAGPSPSEALLTAPPSVFFWNVVAPSWNNYIRRADITVTLPEEVGTAQCSVGCGYVSRGGPSTASSNCRFAWR